MFRNLNGSDHIQVSYFTIHPTVTLLWLCMVLISRCVVCLGLDNLAKVKANMPQSKVYNYSVLIE